MGNWMHHGYMNYTEWKKKDPESYSKHLDRMEAIYKEDVKFDVDEALAAKIAAIKIDPNDEFANAIRRAVKGELTPEEMAICERGPKGIVAPPLPPKRWYEKIWDWIKAIFAKKQKTINDFKEYVPAQSKPVSSYMPDVQINEDFDFQEWVIERKDRIINAIKEDGQEENTITCPICYDERQYYVASNGHIHSSCNKCQIRIAQ